MQVITRHTITPLCLGVSALTYPPQGIASLFVRSVPDAPCAVVHPIYRTL